MGKAPLKPYGVYHVDKFTRYLLFLADHEGAAINWVLETYAGRFMPGRDHVRIYRPDGSLLTEYEVDYMPQFEKKESWTFKSKTNPNQKPYETRLTTQDMLSCDCRGWTFLKKDKFTGKPIPRTCKHIKEIIATKGFQVEARGQYLFVANQKLKQAKVALAKSPREVFARLIAAYEAAIDHMASLDPDRMMSAIPAVEDAKFKVECYMEKLEQLGIDGAEAFGAAQAKLKQALA